MLRLVGESGPAEGHKWQEGSKQASRSLCGAFAESAQGRASAGGCISALPVPVAAPEQERKPERGDLWFHPLPHSLARRSARWCTRCPSRPGATFPWLAPGCPLPAQAQRWAPQRARAARRGPGRQPFAPEQDISADASVHKAHAIARPPVGLAGGSGLTVAMAESNASAGLSSVAGAEAIAHTLPWNGQEPAQAAAVLADPDEQSAAPHSESQPMCTYEGQSAAGSRRQTASSYRSCDVDWPQGRDEELPVSYSGFSSDMRAAAIATADSLFRQAEASSADSSQEGPEKGTVSAQRANVAPPFSSQSLGGAANWSSCVSCTMSPVLWFVTASIC